MAPRCQALALAAALAATTACSFLTVERAPAQVAAGEDPECTDGWTSPAVDAVVAVLAGVLSVNLFIAAANDDDGGSGLRTGAIATAGAGAVFLAGTGYGVIHVNRCRGARQRAGAYEPAGVREWDARPAGSRGGRCRDDGGCDGDLICDMPMRTCIPIDDTGETL